MTKLDYLKLAIEHNLYRHKAWMVTVFAISENNSKEPLQIATSQVGCTFIDLNGNTIKIDDFVPGVPLFHWKDELTVDSSWCGNISGSIKTTIGNLLTNLIIISYPFRKVIPYMEGKISVNDIEDIVAPILTDDPIDESTYDQTKIYCRDYVKFVDATQYLCGLTQLAVWAATEKNTISAPGIDKFKKELIKKYGDKLSDQAEFVKFQNELTDYDNKFMKNDPSVGVLLSGKVMVARKRMFITIGSEAGFSDAAKVEPILSSLSEGWPTDKKSLTTLFNASRRGSYFRGIETIKGGVSAKILARAFSSYTVSANDCGSTLGIDRIYDKSNYNKLVGRYIRKNGKWVLVEDEELAKQYIDTVQVVRSPLYCKEEGEKICSKCAGARLAENPNNLTDPITNISNIILYTAMSAMHAKALRVKEMDISKLLS